MQYYGLECVESHLGSVIVGCQSQAGGNTIVLKEGRGRGTCNSRLETLGWPLVTTLVIAKIDLSLEQIKFPNPSSFLHLRPVFSPFGAELKET